MANYSKSIVVKSEIFYCVTMKISLGTRMAIRSLAFAGQKCLTKISAVVCDFEPNSLGCKVQIYRPAQIIPGRSMGSFPWQVGEVCLNYAQHNLYWLSLLQRTKPICKNHRSSWGTCNCNCRGSWEPVPTACRQLQGLISTNACPL